MSNDGSVVAFDRDEYNRLVSLVTELHQDLQNALKGKNIEVSTAGFTVTGADGTLRWKPMVDFNRWTTKLGGALDEQTKARIGELETYSKTLQSLSVHLDTTNDLANVEASSGA